MIKLLINDSSKHNLLEETSFGGFPVKGINETIDWPKCKTCAAELQFLGKIKTDIGFELIFMCNNVFGEHYKSPGICDIWDPDRGANCVIIVNGNELEFFKPIDKKLSLRETEYGVKLIEVEAEDYYNSRENWKGDKRDILGQLYGEPSWYQHDETPDCDVCKTPMRFVAQLEEGPDYETAMNFGCGVAYLFDCVIDKKAKFLWQC